MANNAQRTTHDIRTDETKPSLRTTELIVYVAAVIAVVVTAFVVDGDASAGEGDPFGAEQALRYINYLTICYMVARGLAKSGSLDSYDVNDR